VPETITSGHGPQFTSKVWLQLCNILHITHHQTTAYHPESNGAVERFHCCLKDGLGACTAAATWAEEIPWVLLGLHAQLREDIGLSPAEAVFGAPIVLPNEFLKGDEIPVDTISKNFLKSLDAPAFSLPRHNSSRQLPSELPAELLNTRLVWVRRGGVVPPLNSLYDGPYAVLCRGPRAFTLQVGQREESIAVSRLKTCAAVDAMPGCPVWGSVSLPQYLTPSIKFFFFFCMYQLIHTMNMYPSNTHTYTFSYFIIRAIANIYSMIQSIYYFILGSSINMISSCSHDIIISTFEMWWVKTHLPATHILPILGTCFS
jgi:hypothetical protein